MYRIKWEHKRIVHEDAVDYLEKILRQLVQAFIDAAVHIKDPKYKTMRLVDMLVGIQMILSISYEMPVKTKVNQVIKYYNYLIHKCNLTANAAMAKMQDIEFKANTFQEMFKNSYPNIRVCNEAYIALQAVLGLILSDLFNTFSFQNVRNGYKLDFVKSVIDKTISYRNMFYRHKYEPTSIEMEALPPLTKSIYDNLISKIRGTCKRVAPDAMQHIQSLAAGLLNRILKIIHKDTKCSHDYDYLYTVLHKNMLANQLLTQCYESWFENNDISLKTIVEQFKKDTKIQHETIVIWINMLSDPQAPILNESTIWMIHLIVESYIINILDKSCTYAKYMQRAIITRKYIEVVMEYV
ncbi:hypothetical protein GUITHDRAFT_149031 [Guillardia theta CCMP2712]|uniref:Uncharacterized protein n=1 Tax=Guillardia theta (strain CCMP2712) TaxID=905079 RepID=L1I7J3_GUITC|nr:hypothetical protein GUITHDRAFT_149031 [Guillardia theta CCMP2712]EKX31849.1 hypothetical protein GUITHDRAFT_149031 [Guillardia theta CCMP2712]|eukprot:XP_005818829.1 hypothetical protein GUITHDRAFT_149031 [Guillardia theta CCMP2712]